MPSITERRPDIPRAIDDMVQRACAKDRDPRFAGTHDFLSALDAADPATLGAPHPSRPPAAKTEVPPPPRLPPRRCPTRWSLAAAEVRLESVRCPNRRRSPSNRYAPTRPPAELPSRPDLSFGRVAGGTGMWMLGLGVARGGRRGRTLLLLDDREEAIAPKLTAGAGTRGGAQTSKRESAKRLPRCPKHARPSRRSPRWWEPGAARASAIWRRFSRPTTTRVPGPQSHRNTPVRATRTETCVFGSLLSPTSTRTSSRSKTIFAPRLPGRRLRHLDIARFLRRSLDRVKGKKLRAQFDGTSRLTVDSLGSEPRPTSSRHRERKSSRASASRRPRPIRSRASCRACNKSSLDLGYPGLKSGAADPSL